MASALSSSDPFSTGGNVDHDVVIAGGGPTGLTLAAELALAGIDVAVVERRPDRHLPGSRSGGLQARTIEMYDQRGVAARFLEAGYTAQVNGFAGVQFDLGDVPTRHPYGLALWQGPFEEILAAWVAELGVPVLHGREVTGFSQDESGVDLQLADGARARAQYVVAPDGGRSVVRKAAGIPFTGSDPTSSTLIAEVQVADEPEMGMKRDSRGIHGIGPLDDPGFVRVVIREAEAHPTTDATLETLRAEMRAVWGTDFGVHGPRWISRFNDAARQAESYRAGRVLLAGDAAHVHSPVGGQGLNTGVQDATNLGWKLAQVVRGVSPESLLDTYEAERHPVAARVLKTTLAQTELMPDDDRTSALRSIVAELVAMDEPRRRLAGELSQLDLHYDLGEGHPLLGRRMPDLDLVDAGGAQRVYDLMHAARPLLLQFDAEAARHADVARWADRVDIVAATTHGPWELPVLGAVDAPAAVLVRPDGYVAWIGDVADPSLVDALAFWFGAGTDPVGSGARDQ